jgi:hypothetical protein
MTLDQWHAKAIENAELIDWLRDELDIALRAQHAIFSEIVETSGVVDDSSGETASQTK